MQLFHIRKQLFGGKNVNQKPGLFALAVAACHRRELRIDGAPSRAVALPLLKQPLWKQGTAESDVSPPRSHQGGFGRKSLTANGPESFEHAP